MLTALNRHEEAERCNARCVEQQPDNPQYLYNWAVALTATGKLAAAEAAYDRVIALAPQDADAYYNRATLRAQTAAANHVGEIRARLAWLHEDDPALVALSYALAKELEDLGEYPLAFEALRRGATGRRRRLSYQVQDDEQAMRAIAATFDTAWLAGPHAGHEDARPVFVVGLPRSGTTLVDRILSSHSAVTSRGESSDLAAAVVQAAGAVPRSGAARGKLELIGQAARSDMTGLGAAYCRGLPAGGQARIVDKTPLNFLYVGLIRAALPRARIIHVRRQPMAVCYAIYKTLFRMAYPFSYDLADLARYYLAYHRLMAHWRAMLPAGAMLEIDYEDLVRDQEGVTRRLLEHCGLAWEASCLNFERNASPTLTASAAQVRRPIYASSVEQWRCYRHELEPLAALLAAGGIDPGAA